MKSAKLAVLATITLAILGTTACGTKTPQPSASASPPPGSSTGNSTSGAATSGQSSGLNTNIGAKGVNKKVSQQQKVQAQKTINQIVNAVNQLK